MPKFTQTGYEVGSSDSPAIVLMETPYETNQDVLTRHRDKRNNVERIDTYKQRNPVWSEAFYKAIANSYMAININRGKSKKYSSSKT